MHRVHLLNGPNLNLLGQREPDVYGSTTLADVEHDAIGLGADLGLAVECHQSNHEGGLVDLVQAARADGAAVIINPGGYSHTSVAVPDALRALERPYIEVHVSNIHAREPYRHHSYFSAGAAGVIVGCGVHGYQLAVRHLAHLLAD